MQFLRPTLLKCLSQQFDPASTKVASISGHLYPNKNVGVVRGTRRFITISSNSPQCAILAAIAERDLRNEANRRTSANHCLPLRNSFSIIGKHSSIIRRLNSVAGVQDEVTEGISEDPEVLKERDLLATKNIIAKVNEQIKSESAGRLFAVVQVCGKQFKVTTNDIIIVQEYWPPSTGDRIRLEKVLLAGCSDFTLMGRPLLPRDLVRIEGTVIEKTLSYTKMHFKFKKRKNYRRLKFTKSHYSMVRINSIKFDGTVDDSKDVEGLRPIMRLK